MKNKILINERENRNMRDSIARGYVTIKNDKGEVLVDNHNMIVLEGRSEILRSILTGNKLNINQMFIGGDNQLTTPDMNFQYIANKTIIPLSDGTNFSDNIGVNAGNPAFMNDVDYTLRKFVFIRDTSNKNKDVYYMSIFNDYDIKEIGGRYHAYLYKESKLEVPFDIDLGTKTPSEKDFVKKGAGALTIDGEIVSINMPSIGYNVLDNKKYRAISLEYNDVKGKMVSSFVKNISDNLVFVGPNNDQSISLEITPSVVAEPFLKITAILDGNKYNMTISELGLATENKLFSRVVFEPISIASESTYEVVYYIYF